jgi:hypothetical protein
VVEGVALEEALDDVDGTVLSFFDPQPAIPNTIAAESVRAAAATSGRDASVGLCARTPLTPLRD